MKKMIILVMSVCLAGVLLVMCGCSGNSSSSSSPTSNSENTNANEPQDLILVDSNYVLSNGYVHYALEIENPNSNYAPDFATVTVTGKHADGSIAFSDDWTISSIMPGSTTYWASQAGDGDSVESDVIEITLSVKESNWKKAEQAYPADLYSFNNVSVTPSQFGWLSAKGEMTLNEDIDLKLHNAKTPMVVCILKDADGKIVAGFDGFIHNELTVGAPSVFDINSMFKIKAEYATAEMYANPW